MNQRIKDIMLYESDILAIEDDSITLSIKQKWIAIFRH
jgi:hypothetical protein